MKAAVLSLVLAYCGTGMAYAQDFASRFMMNFNKDTSIHCRTISPKMMEKLVRIHQEKENEPVSDELITKLKSARIIQSGNDPKYFHHAVKLIKQNRQRFIPINATAAQGDNRIFVRRKDNTIIELVMINQNNEMSTFTIINLTGDMDEEFIQKLSGVE